MDKERAFHLFCQSITARGGAMPQGKAAVGLAQSCVRAVEMFDAGCRELADQRKADAAAADTKKGNNK